MEKALAPEFFKFSISLAVETMLAMMTQSGNALHNGKAMLEHVITVVLKQAKDDHCHGPG